MPRQPPHNLFKFWVFEYMQEYGTPQSTKTFSTFFRYTPMERNGDRGRGAAMSIYNVRTVDYRTIYIYILLSID